jgi:hypothetical protein
MKMQRRLKKRHQRGDQIVAIFAWSFHHIFAHPVRDTMHGLSLNMLKKFRKLPSARRIC